MFIRLAIQYFSISRIRSKAKLLLDHPIKVYQVDANIIPFSFGNSIFINQDLHAEEELKEIIRHEFIHIRQKHSVDMIWGELLCIFNWYNPFAWLIRRSIRQNLEFIADDKVLRNGVDRKQYQYLLLKVIGVSQFSIANQFNFSSLKKRIAMMNKMRSARLQLVKFLFIIPLVIVLLLAFRGQQQTDTIPSVIPLSTTDTIPDKYKALPKEFEDIDIINKSKTTMKNGKRVTVTTVESVVITLKDGTKESYKFGDPADEAAFEKKYKRSLESILPPPPPPPPGSPDKLSPNGSKDLPLPPPPPPAPPVKDLPEAINDVDVKEFTVTIKRKDGKVETYDLKVTGDLQDFEKKYGRRLEDMVPCTPVTPAKPGAKPKNPAPANGQTKGSVPLNSPIPPATDLEPPSKTGLPAPIKNGPTAPGKSGLPAPVKKEPASKPIEATDLNDLKIDASLDGPGNPNKRVSISIRNVNDPLGTQNPLIIIDGKESPIQSINELKIDPETIESISVLKGESAKAYGTKGQYGVIIITTKKMGPAVKDTTKYRDKITSIKSGIKQWELVKDVKGRKVFMVDKKFLTDKENEFENWLSKNEIHLIEFNSNENDLRKYNLDANGGIINAVTPKNKSNDAAYLSPPKPASPDMMERIYAEARERNCLFIGIKNPIAFKAEGVETRDLVVKMDGSDQGVSYENGTFNIVPRNGTHGTNIKIDIYRKDSNGNLKLLNTRYFRSERLPPPDKFLTT